ncbi:hypothetical protein GOP47_0012012 [Adiantum capillus-veneris]|uniref:Dof-type domain-containing protein n=1 Tax=Adiantum capillus-veneris TaxID=13818 RepID=A0A9D4UTV2_ADICA|nr:hypothetical protein GOP47_0012012 [Adiantum capillus-veneris]
MSLCASRSQLKPPNAMKQSLFDQNGRPDKPVPCPRCHSLNTKFCYFNNYNVKQPRHFCRECQRYWTAGGSLRNVPIGAGRRKHKIAATLSSKLRGSAEAAAAKLNSESDKYGYTAPINPYPSLPLKQLVTNGSYLQEVQNLMGMQCPDEMSVCGSNKSWFSQVIQKPAMDLTQNSSISMVSDRHISHGSVFTSPHCDTQMGGILQKSERNVTNEQGADAQKTTCGYDEMDQNDVHDDACGNRDPNMWPSHTTNTCVRLPSATCGTPETIFNTEQGESTTTLASSSSSEAATSLNGAHSAANNLSSVSNSASLESIPAFWGPLMWPWIWPFLASGAANAHNLAAGIGALAANVASHAEEAGGANNASHFDMMCVSGSGPSFPHWPYIWNTLPWASPWNIAWNASNVGHSLSSQEPEKEKQGLLCIPKTLRMDHPDEASYSSILKTLGVTALPQSGLLNSFQPKAEVFQPKFISPKTVERSELHCHPLPHLNPAAQARSVAFQEGS